MEKGVCCKAAYLSNDKPKDVENVFRLIVECVPLSGDLVCNETAPSRYD